MGGFVEGPEETKSPAKSSGPEVFAAVDDDAELSSRSISDRPPAAGPSSAGMGFEAVA
jgi:hypothetical protein